MRNLTIGLAALGLAALSADALAHRYTTDERYVFSIGGPGDGYSEATEREIFGHVFAMSYYWIIPGERMACKLMMDGAETGLALSHPAGVWTESSATTQYYLHTTETMTINQRLRAWAYFVVDDRGGCTVWANIEKLND